MACVVNLLDERGTHVRSSNAVTGGFTLNFLNLILLQPPPANGAEAEFKRWVTILAHEACHIEQRFWVDSVEQEMGAVCDPMPGGAGIGR